MSGGKNTLILLICFLFISAFVLFLNTFPNFYAYSKTPMGMSYSGQASWFDPWDINVYVSAIHWGQQGHILLQNNYTTEPHNSILMYPIYTFSGFIFRDISPFLLFHLLAVVIGLLLLLVIWRLSLVFLKNEFNSLLATLLVSLGGGIGWLFFSKIQSADLYITGFTFVSQFQRAHEALGVIFYLLALVTFYIAIATKQTSFYLISLSTLLILIFLYPYYLLSYALICGLYSLATYFKKGTKKPIAFVLINTFIGSLVLLFYFIHVSSSIGFSGVLSQQLTRPNPLEILFGFGILSLFILFQLKIRPRSEGQTFLNTWFFISLFLIILPLGFSRFYLRSLFFPAVILTLLSLKEISLKLHISRTYLISALLILLPISSFYITFKRLAEAGSSNPWFYITTSQRNALNFFNKEAAPGSGVIADYVLGNYIPANTSNKVYFGHLLQTPNPQGKMDDLINFYSSKMPEEQAKKFLKDSYINYIYWSSSFGGSSPSYNLLHPVFEEKNTIIYSVSTN